MSELERCGWSPATTEGVRERLLAWFDREQRELPWRGISDPYGILVSEMMLQQTQVATVIDYYERWMARFPTLVDLARSPLEEVLEVWAGLGYYRRARFLHRAAVHVVDQWQGEFPRTARDLRELPGVGAYTAGAVASIAFGEREPIVDGNVTRVLARWFRLEGDLSRGSGHRMLWQLASELVDEHRPGDFNQALMELGATVCSPRAPQCARCPVAGDCQGLSSGSPTDYPEPSARTKSRTVAVRCLVLMTMAEDGPRFLVEQRPEQGLLAGLWQFPMVESQGTEHDLPPGEDLEHLGQRLGIELARQSRRPMGRVVHQFSHRRWLIDADLIVVDGAVLSVREPREGVRWVDEAALAVLPVPTVVRKVQALLHAPLLPLTDF
jgi:A/G-specific adenine glycosylase